jgi:glycosyltransferase involved in cell wall biosynthesis
LADRILCVSEAVANDYRTARNYNKVQVLYNGILEQSLLKVSKKSVKKELGFEASDLVIGTVSFLIPRKRVGILIELADLLRSFSKIKFLIVGKGPLEEELKNQVIQLKLEDKVKFIGHSNQVLRLMRGIDIFTLFSEKEPFGLVILEALSQEVPIVASNIDGIREAIREGMDGYLVDPTDLIQVRDRILELAKNGALRKRMGILGRQHLLADFSHEAFLKGIEQVYEEVLS